VFVSTLGRYTTARPGVPSTQFYSGLVVPYIQASRNEITQRHRVTVRLLPVARSLTASQPPARVCGPGGWSRRPARVRASPRLVTVCWTSTGPSWDLDKQPFVFVVAFVSQCARRPAHRRRTASTWTHCIASETVLSWHGTTHYAAAAAAAAAATVVTLGPTAQTTLAAISYLFILSAVERRAESWRLIPLLCAFYFTQRTRSKWRKAVSPWLAQWGPIDVNSRQLAKLTRH